MIECQVEDCDNVAVYVTLKGEYLCHKHNVEPSELADQELDRRAELNKWESREDMKRW